MTREERILDIARLLKTVIAANPEMCCFGTKIDEQGNEMEWLIGFDGYIDLKQLAEVVYVRMG